MHGLFGPLFALVFPDDCRICHAPLREISRVPVCSSCLREPQPLTADFFCSSCRAPFVNRFPLDENGQCALCRLGLNDFDAAYSYGFYEGHLRTLIHLFKFEKIHTLARPLGKLLAQVLPRSERFDAIVPMPLHWRRRWQRGFNQSDLLAREIAGSWGVPVRRAVRRVRASVPQSGLTKSQRRANVRGVFDLRSGVSLQGARVLLVDDVFTTGATASACAKVLKRAGAARVTLLTVARTDRRMYADVESRTSPVSAASAAGSTL